MRASLSDLILEKDALVTGWRTGSPGQSLIGQGQQILLSHWSGPSHSTALSLVKRLSPRTLNRIIYLHLILKKWPKVKTDDRTSKSSGSIRKQEPGVGRGGGMG